MNESAGNTAVSKSPVLLGMLAGLVIGGAAVGTGEYVVDQNSLSNKLDLAKVETLADVQIPERPDVVYIDTIIAEDTVQVLDTVGTIPARVDPIMSKYSSKYITGENDTIVATYTLKNRDSIIYCVTLTPSASCEYVIKNQFIREPSRDTTVR